MEALRRLGAHIFAGKKLPRSIITMPLKTAPLQLESATWPDLATPLTLTLGKGGVGKTTVSAGLAYHHRKSKKGEAVMVCSIDPAPSLDDIFAVKVGNKLEPVLGDRKLLAIEIDAMADFRQWTGQLRARLNQAMTSEQSGIHLDVSLDRKFLLALLEVVPPGVDEIFATFGYSICWRPAIAW
jgi:anion-transporting  ArsA/GET3 family ATPase